MSEKIVYRAGILNLAFPAYVGLKMFAGYFATWSWWWVFAPLVPITVEFVQWVAKR